MYVMFYGIELSDGEELCTDCPLIEKLVVIEIWSDDSLSHS